MADDKKNKKEPSKGPWMEGKDYTEAGAFPPGEELLEAMMLIQKYGDVSSIPEDELPTPARMREAYPDVKHGFLDTRIIRATLRDRRSRFIQPFDIHSAKKAQTASVKKRAENKRRKEDLRIKVEAINEILQGTKESSDGAPKAIEVMRMLMVDAIEEGDLDMAGDLAAKIIPYEESRLSSVETKTTVSFDPKMATDEELDLYDSQKLSAEDIHERIEKRRKGEK